MDINKLQAVLMSRGIRVADDDPVFTLVALNEAALHEIVDAHQHALTAQINTLLSAMESTYAPQKIKEVSLSQVQVLADSTLLLRQHLDDAKKENLKTQNLHAAAQEKNIERIGRYAQKKIQDEIEATFAAEFRQMTTNFQRVFGETVERVNSIVGVIEITTATIVTSAESVTKTAATKSATREKIHRDELTKWILFSSLIGGVSAAVVSTIALKIMH